MPCRLLEDLSKTQPGLDENSGLASSIPKLASEAVSTQLLQSGATDREDEQERRHKNGNVPPRQGKGGGKNLDQTCL